MKLSEQELQNRGQWEEKGYILPKYNREQMIKNTRENPEWVHFGAGNIFRAFPAVVCETLLNEGIMNTGIVVAEGYDYEIIDKSFKEFDDLILSVTLKGNGEIEKQIVGSIAESLRVDRENKEDWSRLSDIFKSDSLKMVSFTITEKGYSLRNGKNEYLPDVAEDFDNEPESAKSYMGKLVSLCYERYKAEKTPLTLVSMDNCSHNGTRLMDAVAEFAEKWVQNGKAEEGFLSYVKEDIAYPWSMIDKITPRPAEAVKEILTKDGLEIDDSVVTKKNTYIAPFVNAEECEYLVIEDIFKNGKLPLDKGGVIYTDRETVDKVEKMKVCTCLNPLHTALAIYGCLLGYTKISEEMKDENLVNLIKKVGYQEGLPVVVDPMILSPEKFIDEVIGERFPNPFMPDAPQRIACDTSQKLAIRFGETIKAYDKKEGMSASELEYIPLVLAGWCRYLMAIDDKGNKFELSPDPMLTTVVPVMGNIKLGENGNVHQVLSGILSNDKIFGVNLYDVGLGEKAEALFSELNNGVGAVRATLEKYC